MLSKTPLNQEVCSLTLYELINKIEESAHFCGLSYVFLDKETTIFIEDYERL